ncbi:hypothetical protein XELAEV_18031179mg [Xenopus laevis]|uniref:Uncharacterized protein n=1 Tax=Xenopus laevis TaxID=8355 RepID=A0A974HFD8_XENLA|nr:hypothetical protein XELAEV_18031179mg [Xenopus laevis]
MKWQCRLCSSINIPVISFIQSDQQPDLANGDKQNHSYTQGALTPSQQYKTKGNGFKGNKANICKADFMLQLI